jgi:peptidoglycan/xylan/chitin deacetylase (PgdA/CDA1 family)
MCEAAMLRVIMYHYVRDYARDRFSDLKGMDVRDFRTQVRDLAATHEMVGLETALAYLAGDYEPKRDLCLLTFDDGLREHAELVTPFLSELGFSAIFAAITQCVDEHVIAPVHLNHLLMADLGFTDYRQRFEARLAEIVDPAQFIVDPSKAQKTYRWDTLEVAMFKYQLNFLLPELLKVTVLRDLAAEHFGDLAELAKYFYASWPELQAMQSAGMTLAGHSHKHMALATLSEADQTVDLQRCTQLMRRHCQEQSLWPFTYPYGKRESFTAHSHASLAGLGYCCAFSTEVGDNEPGQDLWCIRRLDPKDVSREYQPGLEAQP